MPILFAVIMWAIAIALLIATMLLLWIAYKED